MPFVAMVIVALALNTIMVMVMMPMTCAGAAQECHRTVDEFCLRDGAILVHVECTEQDLGAPHGA